jgi:hypothetical protein
MKDISLSILFCMLGAFSACKQSDSLVGPGETGPVLLSLGTGYAANTKVTVFALDTLRVGYDSLYIQFADSTSQTILQTMEVTVTPMMYMTTMSHSSPVEQCVMPGAINNLFPCAAVFTMPSNAMEPWKLKVGFVDTIRHVNGSVEIPVTILNSSMVNILTAPDSTRYFVTMRSMASPKVGANACEFLVHKRQSMMSFPAVTDVLLEMTPDMPSMGHGSPGNVDPTHISMGHYKGTVNFTMTGEWRITLLLKKGTTTLGSAVFWITL